MFGDGFLGVDRFRRLELSGHSPRTQLDVIYPELTPMIRPLGLSVVVVCLIGWASPVEAQMAAKAYDRNASASVVSLHRTALYGGFGLETMQIPFAGTAVVDRFGLVHRVSPGELAGAGGAHHSLA